MQSKRVLSMVAVGVLLAGGIPFSSAAAAAESAAPVLATVVDDVSTGAVTVEVPPAYEPVEIPETDDEVKIAILYAILDVDPDSAVRSAGDAAMAGAPEDRVAFLESGLRTAHEEDDRFAVAQILGDPDSGPSVRDHAEEALDSGDPAVIREFLETGIAWAQFEDNRIKAFRLLGAPDSGPAVINGAEEALEDGSAEAMREFFESGLAAAREADNHFDVVEALGDMNEGSPAWEAAQAALDGTPEDWVDFLMIYEAGWCEVLDA